LPIYGPAVPAWWHWGDGSNGEDCAGALEADQVICHSLATQRDVCGSPGDCHCREMDARPCVGAAVLKRPLGDFYLCASLVGVSHVPDDGRALYLRKQGTP